MSLDGIPTALSSALQGLDWGQEQFAAGAGQMLGGDIVEGSMQMALGKLHIAASISVIRAADESMKSTLDLLV